MYENTVPRMYVLGTNFHTLALGIGEGVNYNQRGYKMKIIETWTCGCQVIEDEDGYRYRDIICN